MDMDFGLGGVPAGMETRDSNDRLRPVTGSSEAEAAPYAFEPGHIEETCPSVVTDRPTRGTFLDETIGFRGPEGEALTAAVMEIVARYRDAQRERRIDYQKNDRNLVACILANGLRCRWHRDPPVTSYFRKSDPEAYLGKPNKPVWLSGKGLARETDLLAEAGLLRLLPGRRLTSSGYIVTDDLLKLAKDHRVTNRSLCRTFHRDDLVQLRSAKPKPDFDKIERRLIRHKGPRLLFDPTPEVEAWKDALAAYNDFLARQIIEVDPPADILARWVENLNGDPAHTGGLLYQPELFRCAVYRVFNGGIPEKPSFLLGGRLAGGWWLKARKEVRPYITINGEQTVEVDYSACHPRMLYHERRLECPDDPYDIPEIAEVERSAGLKPGYYRAGIKWLTQVLINGRGRPDLTLRDEDALLPEGISFSDLTKMIERKNAPIADTLKTGAGLRLMRIESDIAMAIMTKARERGWLALPIHDSFVGPISHKEEIINLTKAEYQTRMKYEPITTIS